MTRSLILALLLSSAAAKAAAPGMAPDQASARPLAKGKLMAGLLVDLKTADNWTLKAKHLPAKDQRKTFILLHGTGGRKEDWYYLARALAGWGYGYLALDFRGHGESRIAPDGQALSWHKFKVTKAENEFANMSRDVDAAFAYLVAQGVAEEQIGVIGADVGSSLGLKFSAVHPKIPLTILLSPGLHYQEVLTVNAMRAYRGRPILMIYSEADKYSSRETPLLYGFAKLSTGEPNVTLLTVPQEHGVKMLRRQRDLIPKIIDWIGNPVKAVGVAGSTMSVSGSSAPAADFSPEEPADESQAPGGVQ